MGWQGWPPMVWVVALMLLPAVYGDTDGWSSTSAPASNPKDQTTFGVELQDVDPGWRQRVMIVTSLVVVVAAFVGMLCCCCRICKTGDPPQTQAQAQEQMNLRRLEMMGVFPRASFYAPPPRYSALIRSQSQRRKRLGALERAAKSSLPRYADAVKQLEEAEEVHSPEAYVIVNESETGPDLTEILLDQNPQNPQTEQAVANGAVTSYDAETPQSKTVTSTSADNVNTAIAIRETLEVNSGRPLFHSADSLLAAETTVALEDEIDSNFVHQMGARSVSCGDLLDMPEPNRVILRNKNLLLRLDSLPPRYSEILEKSKPKRKAVTVVPRP